MKKAQFGAIVRNAIKTGKKAPIADLSKKAKPVKRSLSTERAAAYKGVKPKLNKKELEKQVFLNNPYHNDIMHKLDKSDRKAFKIALATVPVIPAIGAAASVSAAKKDKAVKGKAKAVVAVEKAKAKVAKAKSYKFAKGGSSGDDKWIQKAINPAHKGYCTPMTKPTCTPKRKALAVTLKKMAKNK